MTVCLHTPVTALFQNRFETQFKDKPDHTTYLWDTVAMAYLVDPSLATDVRQLEVDVDDTFGPNYGRSIGYYRNAPQGALEPAGRRCVPDRRRAVLRPLHRPDDPANQVNPRPPLALPRHLGREGERSRRRQLPGVAPRGRLV